MTDKMKLLCVSIFLTLSAVSFAQEASQAQEREMKTGWTLSALPCATYSSDMGFQYGAFGDIYNYGDGNTYPDPLHKISWEVSHFTKGRTRFYLAYDSKYLIPKMRLTASATYIMDPLYNFYGFNAPAYPFDPDLNFNKDYYNITPPTGVVYDNAIPGVAFYNMRRDMARLQVDMRGRIADHLHWGGGISFWHFNADRFNEKYGYNTRYTAYNEYMNYGVIGSHEYKGGNRLEIKGGIVFDSRDIEAAPNKGIWSEVYVNTSPDVFGDEYGYTQLCARWRQYITLPIHIFRAGDPVFAYHLAYQGTLFGETPFYMKQNIALLNMNTMVSEGFGSSNTIRGTYANRIIADGYAWGNFELRVKLVKFTLFGQYFYLATNPFFDCGMITKPTRVDLMTRLPKMQQAANKAGYTDTAQYIRDKASEVLYTAGAGLKLAWNQNFIVSVELAHNFNENLGDPMWINIGMNYSF